MMTAMMPPSALPDPDRQWEFYAGVPVKRLLAWVVDVLIVGAITVLLGIFTLTLAWFFFPIFYIGTAFLYRWITVASGSATPGMRLMALQIRNARGERLDGGEALLHTLGYLVAAGFVLPHLISLGMMALSPRRQGLHDLVLGTAAINRPG